MPPSPKLPLPTQPRRAEWVTLAVIVLLATVLRLSALDLIEFKGDEARHLLNALEITRHGRLPLIGTQASVGVAKPPLMTYLLALPTLLGPDPRLASGLIALLNVAGVAGFMLLARRYYGRWTAAMSGILFAANPWAVLLSRKIFTADLLAPFGVLLLYGLCLGLIERRPGGLTLAIVALGVMLGITFSPWPLVVVVLLLLALYHRRVSWRHVALGLGLVVVLFLPYLYYHFLSRLAELRALLSSAGIGGKAAISGVGGAARWEQALRFATWLHSGLNLVSLTGAAAEHFQPGLGVLDNLAAALFLAALVGVPLLAARALARRATAQDSAPAAIVALWLWVPLLLFPLQPASLEQHYLVILYPVGFLAMGFLLERALARGVGPGRRAPWLPWLIGGVLLALGAHHGHALVSLYGVVTRYATNYGVPYRFWRQTVELVRREAQAAQIEQVWVVASGSDITYEAEPLVLSYLLEPQLKTVFMGQGGNECLLLPVERAGLYLLTRSAPPVETLLQELQAKERGALRFPDRELPVRVLHVPAQPAAALLAHIPQRGTWSADVGARLLGYAWPAAQAGQTVSLTTYWTFGVVPDPERTQQHSVFNHLLASDGDRVAQRDGFGLHERYWAPGLFLVQWFDLALPEDLAAGDYTLLLGMYRLSDGTRSQWVDEQGRPSGDALTLGPVRVQRRTTALRSR